MQYKALSILVTAVCVFGIDAYVISGLSGAMVKWKPTNIKIFKIEYWTLSISLLIGFIVAVYLKVDVGIRSAIFLAFFVIALAKISFLPFVLIDDIRRLFVWLRRKPEQAVAVPASPKQPAENGISRSEFLMKAGLLAGSIPIASMCYGSFSGAYDYHVKRHNLYLPNLPKAFDGMTLGQISDIHSGSFYKRHAVKGGVDMFLREKPDVIFFTGDLVNSMTNEMHDYYDIFNKIKAPLGVYSCTGNHDYGDYAWWPDEASKRKNFEDLIKVHKNMGWDLLMNEHRRFKVDGEEIGILGIENWGALSRFPKYGRMDLAVKDTDDLPVKLLLSHDPSHWRAEVLPKYPQIDMVFAGHTHGMQFGVQTEKFQWSPVEYLYREWAGLYNEGKQQIYVNVGFGFLGYSGRIGILPEITIFTLKSGHAPVSKNT